MSGYRNIDTSVLKNYVPAIGFAGHSGYSGDFRAGDFISRLGWNDDESKSMPDWANQILSTMRNMYAYVLKKEKKSNNYDAQVSFWETDKSFNDLLFWIRNESTFAPTDYLFLDYVARWLKEDPAGTTLTYLEIKQYLDTLFRSHNALTQPLMALIEKWIKDGELQSANISTRQN